MSDAYAYAHGRLIGIGRHPVYPMIMPIPVICFVGALITDVVYASAPDMMWLDFSAWLLLAGLIAGGAAGALLIIETVRAGRRRTGALLAHLGLLFAAWVVEVFNSFIHARDGWTAVVPWGLTLSVLAVALALLAGWAWQAFAHSGAGDAP